MDIRISRVGYLYITTSHFVHMYIYRANKAPNAWCTGSVQ